LIEVPLVNWYTDGKAITISLFSLCCLFSVVTFRVVLSFSLSAPSAYSLLWRLISDYRKLIVNSLLLVIMLNEILKL